MGPPSSERIIQYIDIVLKVLEIVYRANEAAVEVLDDRNRHIWKFLYKGESVSWGGARTNGKGPECELTKKRVLYSDLLKFF